jgi:hypothetical protein
VDTFKGRISQARIWKRAYSAHFTVCLAAKKILMARDARILLHASQSFCYGPAREHAIRAAMLENLTRQTAALLMERAELPSEVVNGFVDGADIYLDAEQSLSLGLVDEVFDVPQPVAIVRPPAPVADTIAPSTPALPTFTADELMLQDFLGALPRLTVHSKAFWMRELCAWAHYNLEENQTS